MKSRSKWAFSSSSSRAIASDSRAGLARIRFPSGSIISERVDGEIEFLFPGETVNRIAPSEKPSEIDREPLPQN